MRSITQQQTERQERAQSQAANYALELVEAGGIKRMIVTNLQTRMVYTVSQRPGQAPSCSCEDWRRRGLPCKHCLLTADVLRQQRAERQRRVTAALEVALAA